jgi:hypothetical protein
MAAVQGNAGDAKAAGLLRRTEHLAEPARSNLPGGGIGARVDAVVGEQARAQGPGKD